MKIIIAGCGEVGSHLAKLLSREEQDITVVDEDSTKLAILDSNYNLLTVQGRPTSFKTLRQAGVEGCDLFIAVTPFETRNIVACAIARSLGAEKTVARVDNFEFKDPDNRNFFASIGTDDLIYPEYLAALEIITALKHNWVRHWFERRRTDTCRSEASRRCPADRQATQGPGTYHTRFPCSSNKTQP